MSKEQGISDFAAADPLGRGCVIYNGWAYAGADDANGNPVAYMRITTELPNTSNPAFDPEPLADLFGSSAWAASPMQYTPESESIDGPGMAWRWWWPLPGWEGWPTKWELWNPNPARDTRPVYAAPSTGPMKFTEDNGAAECLMWPGPSQE